MYQAGTIRRAGDDSGIYEVEAMRRDAETVIQKTIEDVLPMKAVRPYSSGGDTGDGNPAEMRSQYCGNQYGTQASFRD